MNMNLLVKQYEHLLEKLYRNEIYFGNRAVTHFLGDAKLKDTGIKDFYLAKKLEYAGTISPGNPIALQADEHPTICGGVTEYITKIQLARRLGIDIKALRFFANLDDPKYKGMNEIQYC